jgi:radical SAM superfamily enzyme YgiQ (UPF0313 family)
MNRFKILFVTPPYHPYNLADEKVYVVEPIQFEVLAALMDGERFDVRVLDLRLERGKNVFHKVLRDFNPDLVGATSWTMHVTSVRKLLADAKAFNPAIRTIVGGHHTGITPSDFADPNVDFVLMGEGYISFRDLVERIRDGETDFSDLDGVAYQRDGEFYSNGTGVVTKQLNLNDLPFPDRGVISPYRSRYYHLWWKPIASIRTGMGCPSRCSFCNLWRPNLGKYLTWSPDYVVDFLKTLDETYVLFVDDHFFGDVRRAYEIGEKILKANIRNKQYCLYSRSDAIAKHPELVELWARVGLKRVRMGLESYSDEQLDSLTKCNSVENNDAAISVLKKHNIFTEGLFMIGLDYAEKEFSELAHYIKSRKIEVPNITVYTPMPGTTEFETFKNKLEFRDSEYFDFQHATLPTKLDLETFCKRYGRLLLEVQRPPVEQLRLIGVKTFLRRMPSFWRYFFSVRMSYKHYRQRPHSTIMPQLLPWHEADRITKLPVATIPLTSMKKSALMSSKSF